MRLDSKFICRHQSVRRIFTMVVICNAALLTPAYIALRVSALLEKLRPHGAAAAAGPSYRGGSAEGHVFMGWHIGAQIENVPRIALTRAKACKGARFCALCSHGGIKELKQSAQRTSLYRNGSINRRISKSVVYKHRISHKLRINRFL